MTIQQPVDWDLVEDTIFDWLHEDIGFEDVIWGNSKAAQPKYPYVSLLRVAGPTQELNGTDDIRRELKGDGTALIMSYVGPRVFTVSVTVLVGEGDAFEVANSRGSSLLGAVQALILSETTKNRLKLANLAIVDAQNIVDTSVIINGIWNFQATLDIIFRVTSIATEEVGFVEKVQLVSTDLGVDTIIDAS